MVVTGGVLDGEHDADIRDIGYLESHRPSPWQRTGTGARIDHLGQDDVARLDRADGVERHADLYHLSDGRRHPGADFGMADPARWAQGGGFTIPEDYRGGAEPEGTYAVEGRGHLVTAGATEVDLEATGRWQVEQQREHFLVKPQRSTDWSIR